MAYTVYGQQEVRARIDAAVRAGQLPNALLFSGSRYSGRLTTALETARKVMCHRSGAEDCSCESCRKFGENSQPYAVMLLTRSMIQEIRAAADVAVNDPDGTTMQLFILQVRKLLNRFLMLGDDEGSKAQKQSVKLALEIDDLLLQLSGSSAVLSRDIEQILKKSEQLQGTVKSQNIPIAQIRYLGNWLQTKPGNQRTVVIIEGVEFFTESTKNALLKLLEEPPGNTWFFLISEFPGMIPRTILSRVRKYQLLQREWEEEARVISEVFRKLPDDYDSLKTLFLSNAGVNCRELRDDAERFISAALQRREVAYATLQADIQRISKSGLFREFVEELINIIELEVAESTMQRKKAAVVFGQIQSAYRKVSQVNQNTSLALEAMYYAIRDYRL